MLDWRSTENQAHVRFSGDLSLASIKTTSSVPWLVSPMTRAGVSGICCHFLSPISSRASTIVRSSCPSFAGCSTVATQIGLILSESLSPACTSRSRRGDEAARALPIVTNAANREHRMTQRDGWRRRQWAGLFLAGFIELDLFHDLGIVFEPDRPFARVPRRAPQLHGRQAHCHL